MKFNTGKCQALNITRIRKPLQSQYILHGQLLEAVDNARYLGISISKDLNLNTHINNIIANRTLASIKRNEKKTTTKKHEKTFNESIEELAYKNSTPQVEYAPCTNQNVNKIEMIQRRAARSVKNKYSLRKQTYSNILKILPPKMQVFFFFLNHQK